MKRLPELRSQIGERGSFVTRKGERQYFRIRDAIVIPQSGFREKRICLQLVEFERGGRHGVRLGYYMIGKKGRMVGKWVWGQYATFVRVADFHKLVEKAIDKGWGELSECLKGQPAAGGPR